MRALRWVLKKIQTHPVHALNNDLFCLLFPPPVCVRVCVAVHLLGLTWHLRHGDSQLYENGLSSGDHQQEDHSKSGPTSSIHLLDTLNPENTHAGDRGELTHEHTVYTIITDVLRSNTDRICLSVTTKQM